MDYFAGAVLTVNPSTSNLMFSFLPMRLRHWANALFSTAYRSEMLELRQLAATPRYTETTTRLLGAPLVLPDALSFLNSYREIFRNRIYQFNPGHNSPLIIDCGANIGLSVLWFKQFYPDSRVLAFEADPQIFSILQRNCASFRLEQVELIAAAVWTCETELAFAPEGADAGRMLNPGEVAQGVPVKTRRLRDYLLNEEIEFLKMDIEGAETRVLLDCADALGNVRQLFVEYHSFTSENQSLAVLLDVLTKAGFRYHIQTVNGSAHPFIERETYLGMDLQLNIFAYRSANAHA